MDDITLQIEAATPGEAAASLRVELGEVERALRDDNMRLNDASQQV